MVELAHLDWHKTPTLTSTLAALVTWGAANHGSRDLLVIDELRLSYAEADQRSAAFALQLLSFGVGRGTRVGVLLPNGSEFIVTWFALARIGAVAVPVSTLSSAPELARICRSAGFALLVTTDRQPGTNLLERLASTLQLAEGDTAIASLEVPHLRNIWLWNGTARWANPIVERQSTLAEGNLVAAAEALVTPADTIAVIYTSGSASEPKGVIHSHGNFLRSSRRWAASMPYIDGDRLFAASPMFWVGGLITSLLTMMQVGGALIGSAHTGSELLDVIERERCTALQVWPHLARRIADDPSFAGRDWSAMRVGSIGAMLTAASTDAPPFGFAMGMTGPACTGYGSSHRRSGYRRATGRGISRRAPSPRRYVDARIRRT